MNPLLAQAKKHLSPEAYEHVAFWLDQYPEFKKDIENLLEQKKWKEIEDAFYTHVEIGTGGIRGTLGVGPNRINTRIIGEAAQGLSQFIKDFGPEAIQKGVVVGHEARKQSQEFARLCCEIFAANGIPSFLFDGLRATPEISFAVRHLGAVAGVQITASHNPRTDNGFKFYWSDGGQVIPPLDIKFMELVKQVDVISRINFFEAQQKGLIKTIGSQVDEAYLSRIQSCSLSDSRSATIVFSPIHGAGITNVLPVLRRQGFTVKVVPEQEKPDENFPTAKGDLINPEYKEVMELAIGLAERLNADLALNADPDADRVGVAAKKSFRSPKLQFLNGNEVGAALTYFILSRLKERGALRPESIVVETNVTTTLISDIAKSFGIRVEDNLLVGFKFIAEVIAKLPSESDFIFAAEESLGYLAGTFVRDKDAAIASLFIAEMASWLKDQGKTVIDYLNEIYGRYGYYHNILYTEEMKGKEGFHNKKNIMEHFRFHPPRTLGDMPVQRIIDRLDPVKAAPDRYKVGSTGDQIAFLLSEGGGTKVTLRPSGTEPKLKYYIQVYQPIKTSLAAAKKEGKDRAKKLLAAILAEQSRLL